MTPIPTPADSVRALLFVLLAGCVPGVSGQEATPVRSFGQASPGMAPSLEVETTQMQVRPLAMTDTTAITHGELHPWWEGAEALALDSMQQKRWDFGVNLLLGWEYDDNVFLSDVMDGGASSYFARLPASLTYKGGRTTFTLSYTPEYRTYDGGGLDDAFNQAASLAAAYEGAKSNLALNVNFAQTDGGNVEVGDRVDALRMTGSLRGSYAVSPKTSVGASVSTSLNDYDSYNSYESYDAGVFVDYAFTPKTQLGVGAGYSITEVDEGLDAEAYNVNGRVNWQATNKISLRGSAGYEFREYDAGETSESPVFSMGLLYNVRDTTSLSLDGYRRNSPSISLINQSYYATGVIASLNQSVAGRFTCTLSAGYENASYESAVEGVSANRDDDYWFIRPQISYTFMSRASLSVYYQYSENQSSTEASSFERNLIGATLSISL